MIHALGTKKINVTPPAAAAVLGGSATCGIVDRAGYDYAVFDFIFGALDTAPTVMKVQESDASNMSGAADITGTRFGTDKNDLDAVSALPGASDDDDIFSIAIDLRGRKRYLQPVFTVGAGGSGASGALIAILCTLYRAEQAPNTAVKAGLNQRLVC